MVMKRICQKKKKINLEAVTEFIVFMWSNDNIIFIQFGYFLPILNWLAIKRQKANKKKFYNDLLSRAAED